MNITEYLNFLNEQSFGIPPASPVKKPQPSKEKPVKRLQPKVPKNPVSPQVTKQKQVPKKNLNSVQNKQQKRNEEIQNQQISPKAYFDYMMWTTKILKNSEIFRKNCYEENCGQFEIGTGDRRICKDRCDIETCKKVIALLRASIGKCNQSKNPEKCKQRYATLIPLYQKKLSKISRKFIEAEKSKKRSDMKVG